MNFVAKKRSWRYIAAAEEAWLYPERQIQSRHWDKLGNGYLFMPDPRSVAFHTEVIFGYGGNRTDTFDEYGRKPWQEGFGSAVEREAEHDTFYAFRGEFARIFGPRRRGRSFSMGRLDDEEDDPEHHKYRLELEAELSGKLRNRSRYRRRSRRS